MSMESNLKRSLFKIAIASLLKNKDKAPERTARNIQELFCRLPDSALTAQLSQEQLIALLKEKDYNDCLDALMSVLS